MKTSTYRSHVLFVLLATPMASAFSMPPEGGGGHNGPNLLGEAIPVQVDRLLTKQEVGGAIAHCVGQTVNEVAQQIFRSSQIVVTESTYTPFKLSDNPAIKGPESYDEVEGTFYNTNFEVGKTKDRSSEDPTYSNWSVANMGSIDKKKKTSSTIFNMHVSLPSGKTYGFRSTNFPFVRFDAKYPDSAYDDLGNLDQSKVKVGKIRIYVPKDLRIDEPLTNTQTEKKTALTMNLRRYVDCIKSKIQN